MKIVPFSAAILVRDSERFWHQQKTLGRDLAARKHFL